MENKIPKWTGDAVKEMHLAHIERKEVEEKLGWHRSYLYQILYGLRTPAGAKAKVMAAIEEIKKEKIS